MTETSKPPRRLKTWGMTASRAFEGGTQVRVIVAASSAAAAASAFGVSPYQFQNRAAQTGNAEEIATAIAAPGVVFWRPLDPYISAFGGEAQRPNDTTWKPLDA